MLAIRLALRVGRHDVDRFLSELTPAQFKELAAYELAEAAATAEGLEIAGMDPTIFGRNVLGV